MAVDDDSLIGLLGQLQDIVEPAPVSMWPATPAWTVLALVVLALLGYAARACLRRRRATAYRRAALAELKALQPALERADAQALAGLDVLIRRTALAAFPRRDVASLTGAEWVAFLDRTGGRFEAFAGALAVDPYSPSARYSNGRALAGAARHWIAHHHA